MKIKIIFVIINLVIISQVINAQGDDPCTAETLEVNSNCINTGGTTVSANSSSVPPPSCNNAYNGGDVWYTATVPESGFMRIDLSGLAMNNGGIAVYSGSDCNNLEEISCDESTWFMPDPIYITPMNELQGQNIWIRVWEANNDSPGSFAICLVEEVDLYISNDTYTPNELVEDILITGCLQAQNAEFHGHENAIGYFIGGTDIIGVESGIVLGTENPEFITGQGNSSVGIYETDQTDVENDLGNISIINNGVPDMHNEAILEFDFIPSSETTEFNFVFASLEYPNFEHSSYNDVFAFFISGPGINGPYTDNAVNIALVPGTSDPITISTINGLIAEGGSGDNSDYFAEYVDPSSNFDVGGYTIPITASISDLTTCEVYHIKLCIADASDFSMQSYVFFEEGSFSSGTNHQYVNYSMEGEETNTIIEGCDYYMVIHRDTTEAFSEVFDLPLNITGSLDVASDLNGFPTSVTFQPYQPTDTIWYSVVLDTEVEGEENMELTTIQGCPCNNAETDTSTSITVIDNYDLNAEITESTEWCEGTDLLIETSINPDIPEGIVNYLWSTGDTTANINVHPDATTTYTVTITGACGTEDVLSTTIDIENATDIEFSFLSDTLCLDEVNTFQYTGTADTALSNITWEFSNGLPATASGPGPHSVYWSTEGNQNVTITVEEDICVNDSVFNIHIASNPSVTFTVNDASCDSSVLGDIITTANGEWQPYSYIWSNGDTSNNITDAPGIYTVTVSNIYDCYSVYSDTIGIEEGTLFTANITEDVHICEGDSVVLETNVSIPESDISYLWSTGDTTSAITAAPLNTTEYIVTMVDNCNIEVVVSTEVNVTNTPDASFYVSKDSICINEITTFQYNGTSGSDTSNITWLFSEGSPDSESGNGPIDVSWEMQGNYIVSMTIEEQNCSNTSSQNIFVFSNPDASFIIEDESCDGSEPGSITPNALGIWQPYSYVWSNGQTSDILTESAGTYDVTVSDINGCEAYFTNTIEQPEGITIQEINDTSVCLTGDAILSPAVLGGTPDFTYQWYNQNDSIISVNPTLNRTNILESATYTIQVRDQNNCFAEQSVNIEVLPPLSLNLSTFKDTICPNESIQIFSDISGGMGEPYTTSWNGNVVENTFTYTPVGSENHHNIIVELNDNCETPSVFDSIEIFVHTMPQVQMRSDKHAGCVPLRVQFSEQGNCTDCEYLWSFDDLNENNISLMRNPYHIFEEEGEYQVELKITSPEGCKSTNRLPYNIIAHPLPNACFMTEPDIVSILDPEVRLHNCSQGGESYYWFFGDGDSSNFYEPYHIYDAQIGNREIMLVTETDYGCRDTTTNIIKISDEAVIYVPSAFTPGTDDVNDAFKAFATGIANDGFSMYIYNRWGEPIFHSNKINESWDGKVNGEMAQSGVYVWLIQYRSKSGVNYEKVGNVTLIR